MDHWLHLILFNMMNPISPFQLIYTVIRKPSFDICVIKFKTQLDQKPTTHLADSYIEHCNTKNTLRNMSTLNDTSNPLHPT